MEGRFVVEGNVLPCHLARPARADAATQPGAVIAHGFPTEAGGGINSTSTMPALADRIAAETGFVALVFASRGTDGAEGSFSLGGWRRDLVGAIDLLTDATDTDGVWIIGFGTGGALAVSVAADDDRVRGVAAVAAPADFSDWAGSPRKLLVWCREIGLVRDRQPPLGLDRWASQLRSVRAVESAAQLGDRSLLVLHGSDDEIVPVADARAIATACPDADLRIIGGAGHHLRHDPRAIAVLQGWLERQHPSRRARQRAGASR